MVAFGTSVPPLRYRQALRRKKALDATPTDIAFVAVRTQRLLREAGTRPREDTHVFRTVFM